MRRWQRRGHRRRPRRSLRDRLLRDALVLDVRTPAEFAAGHLPGAVNIDVESSDFADRVSGLDEGESTLVYCQTGNRSGVATDKMVDLGFTELSELEGGIEAWAAAGEQVVQQ